MEIYSLGRFAQLIGMSKKTVQRWDKEKKIIACRNPSGRRYYTEDQYINYIKANGNLSGVIFLKISAKNDTSISPEKIASLKKFCDSIDIQITD